MTQIDAKIDARTKITGEVQFEFIEFDLWQALSYA